MCRGKNSFFSILWCCKSCSFCRRLAAKERLKSRSSVANKYCERCFLCRSLEFCKYCHKCPDCSICRGQIISVFGKMGSPRHQPQRSYSPQRRLHSTLLVLAKPSQNPKGHKLLCKSPQKQLPVVGGIASASEKNAVEPVNNQTSLGFFSSPQTQQPVETYTGPQQLKQISKDRVIQNSDSRGKKDISADG